MKLGLLLIMLAFASEKQESKTESGAKSEEKIEEINAENLILVKIEEDEYTKVRKKACKYIGVYHNVTKTRWSASRWSKHESKNAYNGSYDDEETAARASDTLARKLMENGEQNHKLNFPDDTTEVSSEKEKTSTYIGVYYHETKGKWCVERRSRNGNKMIWNGSYKDEKTAAHASDTLARKLMKNGEQNHKLNFPDDNTEVYAEEKQSSSKYIGVNYNEKINRWCAARHSKKEKKSVHNGSYKDEITAAHASDILARKLMKNGEQNHKLNFPDDKTEASSEKSQRSKRKRSDHEDLVSK